MSLRTRFLVGLTALTASLAVLITLFAGYRFAEDLEQGVWKLGQHLAESLAREALFSAEFRNDTSRLPLVTESVVSGDVLYAQIVVDGEVVAEKRAVPVELSVHRIVPGLQTYEKTLSDGTPYVDFERSFTGREVTPERADVQRELVGSYVRLGISLAEVRTEIRQGLLVVAGVSLGVIAVGSLMVLVLYRRIWRPIEHISGAMTRFGQGESGVRARVESGDELETLSHAFNQMADALVEKDGQMHRVNLELQQANRAKSDFLASMSHDLKTPLHVISGYAQLMLAGDGGEPGETQRAYLQSVMGSSDQLLEFIERILRYSRIETGREPIQLEATDVAQLTLEAVEPLRSLAERKGLAFELELERPVTARVDRAKLKQVLVNLVENAIKYTERGRVSVALEAAEGEARWAIRDTGPGVPKRYEALIFEPFGRLHNYAGKMTEGMGLGLAIVKRYVADHGGRVSVQSASGRGSTFSVCIPKEVTPE